MSQDKRTEAIIGAAKAILREDGATSLTVRKIMKGAGYATGSFYHSFQTIDDLILTLNHQTLQALHSALRQVLEKRPAPSALGREIGQCYMHFGEQNEPFWHLLFTVGTSPQYPIPQWYQDEVDALFDDLERLLSPYLSEKNRRLTIHTLWCGVHGICSLAFTQKLSVAHHAHPINLCESLFDHFLLAERCFSFTNEQSS